MRKHIKDCEQLYEHLKCLDESLSQTLTDYSLAINCCHRQQNENDAKQQLERAKQGVDQLSKHIAQLALLIKKTQD